MDLDNCFTPHEGREVGAALLDLRVDLQRAVGDLVDKGVLDGLDLLMMDLWLQGYTYREIADALGCSLGLVHRRLEEAFLALARSPLLQGYDE